MLRRAGTTSIAASIHGQEGAMAFDIIRAASGTELDHVRKLMREFLVWHRAHHAEIAMIDRQCDIPAFADELDTLPGLYAPPNGVFLLAYHRGMPAGCVALRNLGLGLCEMKRMFVAEAYRGLRIGRALCDRVIAEAQEIGYRAMRLDASRNQKEAIQLYESNGFQRIHPIDTDPGEWLVSFERDLS
jgi:GNAT superfamily N-acetyltransferase